MIEPEYAELPDLTDRNYSPRQGETIFHYCSGASFWPLCHSRSIWLSSVYTMNDAQELVWGRRLVDDVFAAHPVEFSSSFCRFVRDGLQEADRHLLPLVGSFSKNGDLLSQWRAYSEDGKGFAIELDGVKVSQSLPVNMKNVLYDQEQQEVLILQSLRKFNLYWQRGAAGRLAAASVLPDFATDLVTFKHPSFFEEQEVRMVHLVTRAEGWWLDPGGHNQDDVEIPGVKVARRERGGLDIPYIALPLQDLSAITAVVLGPKNPSSFDEVKDKLKDMGFNNINVRRSAVPYR